MIEYKYKHADLRVVQSTKIFVAKWLMQSSKVQSTEI